MASVSREDVRRIARLARIRVGDEEADALGRELGAVLGYVELLNSLDTSGVEPTGGVLALATPMRADDPAEPLAPGVVVMNAPAAEGSAFAVPRVLGGETEG
ncbi:MAG TPA: Asp-tRNA(Asn)/Glu-tRNA(Gln) amidotransferase subunit GatC [Myxococcota bacterium]